MKKYISLVFLLITCSLYANILTGYGNADNPDTAKALALQDLSSKISVEVQSEIKDYSEEGSVGNVGDSLEYSSSAITVRSDLNILGATFQEGKKGNMYTCKVTLDTVASAPMYQNELYNKVKEISAKVNIIAAKKALNNELKVDLYGELVALIKEFNKLKTVASYLGCKDIPELNTTEAELINEINKLQKKADTLDFAAKVIGKKLKKKANIYVYPMTPSGYHEITDFARSFKEKVQKNIAYTENLSRAQYLLHGKYTLPGNGEDSIQIIYNLTDKNKNSLTTLTVDLMPQAYEGLDYQPKTTTFDQLLHQGIVVSNDFKIDLTTNKGKEDLLFTANETVKILIKVNRAGYYYIVGHVVKENENFSYLLEVSDGMNNRKFISYVNQDDVNKWVELGEFSVEPPYGVESLQVIASTQDFATLPATTYDEKSGYYIISGTAENAVKATRGLKPKKTTEVLSAEDVLFFTTSK